MGTRFARGVPIILAFVVLSLVRPAAAQVESIAAVVNNAVISRADVDNRARLFALSSGIPISPETLNRLKPQILNQLIDEKLRFQEIQREHIDVPDKAVAEAIASIDAQNHLAPGELRKRLEGQGVAFRTLIDQVRVELGWSEVLRQRLGPAAHVSKAEIAARLAALKAETGQPEFLVGEIFIPIDNPERAAAANKFAATVIGELRAGAPFGVVAAQFSQSQTALQGGNLGWVQANQVDPQVARLLSEMPAGAISDPVPVAGGIEIVQLRARRPIGGAATEVASVRQVFIPFKSAFDQKAPTADQRSKIEHVRALTAGAHDCAGMEEANKKAGGARPSNPGNVVISQVTPASFQELLGHLPLDKPSQPLIANDGVAVVMICSRKSEDASAPPPAIIARAILEHRAELLSRQLVSDLRRRAVIDVRGS
ncbi:MAG: peptidylprolyl isomerase [Acetobacteraceae bacterium]